MKRYIKDRKTGLYKRAGAGWGPLAEAFNYGALNFDMDQARKAIDTFRKCGSDVVFVIRRRKPKVSDGERAWRAYVADVARSQGPQAVSTYWETNAQWQRDAWQAAAKAARRRK